MAKIVRILILIGLLVSLALATATRAATPRIDVLVVKGTINPVLVDYIERGIEQAEEDGAVALIIQMDTPGGLDTSMRLIIQAMDRTRVPIVVYVPAGARAASAGFFITIAADVAAMAPDTTIGSAHPVAVGAGGEAQMSETMLEKVENEAVAYARGIALAHGRNVDWAEKAVRDSANVDATRALQLDVIDIIAPDMASLVAQLHNRTVTMPDGSIVVLRTQDAVLRSIPMTWMENFLYTIADPNIAYLLLGLAGLGILTEILNPGLIFPGVVGSISGLLAFYALGMLPVNYAGILLIVLAFGLFVAEVFTAGFGLLTTGGIVSLVIGSLILFKGGPMFRISPWLITVVTVIVAGVFYFIISRVVLAHRRVATTGREELVSKTAVVRVALDPEGTVFYHGELWKAVSEAGRIEPGETVIITRVDGLTLYVTSQGGQPKGTGPDA
ncbi:MAG: nodulation protein NfeD [Chloroflexi bacterium]|nr:nodulation protein NfeD [Chloroflexota bacterium]